MPGKISLQFKFGLSYILVILAVLLLLNTYPLLVSQNLVFRTKQTAMVGSVKIAEAALSGLADLTEDNVAQAMSAVEETGVSRVLVTDTAGRILYDTREGDNARGLYAFYTEIAQALRGNDTFYCRYDGEAFLSRGASPVVYHNQIVGAVYAYEYDTVQAELLRSFQTNIMRISLLVALFVLFLSALLSRMFTRRISDLLQAIRQVREGAYSHRAKVTGSDEIAQLAAEFNSLTDRLQRTESARRQFVSDASHELKTPLAGIRLLTDSILQTDDMNAETTREFVADIGEEAQRLTRITEDLLRLTRLDSGAAAEPAPVAVAPVLRRVVRMLAVVAREQETTLSYEADESAVVLATSGEVKIIILAVAIAAPIEHWLKKVIPDVIKLFVVPFVTLVIMVPLTYLVIGPVASILCSILSLIFNAIYSIPVVGGIIGGILIGAFWQVLVIFGLTGAWSRWP